jgi:tetratricopeptide (TPR) repeat protein
MLGESVRSVGRRVISYRATSDKDALVDFSVRRQSLRKLIYVTTLLLVAVTASQARAQTGQSGGASDSSRPSSRNLPSAFSELEKKATAAREDGRFADAIALYRKGVATHPRWDEGWWYLATLLYESDQYNEAAQAFRRVVALRPGSGAPLAMLGLCEFELGRYDKALLHIRQGSSENFPDNPELKHVVRFHEGQLWLYKGEFEAAQEILDSLSGEGFVNEDLILGLGLSVLRTARMPGQISTRESAHDLIRRAGWAELLSAQKNFTEAEREYHRISVDFSDTPNVHLAYGRYFLRRKLEKEAVEQFEEEIRKFPADFMARLYIAYLKLENKQPAEGIKLAQEAVQRNPRFPMGHYILGRLLLDNGETDQSIGELQEACALLPDEPKFYFSLSRAYTRAKRKEEAERARQTFLRLSQQAEQVRGGGFGVDETLSASDSPQ